MRKFLAVMAVVSLAFCAHGQVLGSTEQPVSDYGFSVVTNIVDSSWVWTNDCVYPWQFSGVTVRMADTNVNTFSITRVRNAVIGFQYRGYITETNMPSVVVTNWSSEITNKVYATFTNVIFTATVTNDPDAVWNIGPNSDDLQQGVYQWVGDVFTFAVTPTSSTPIAFDTIR